MAAVCRSVCGVTFFSLMDGQAASAVAACLATSLSTASRESLACRLGRGTAGCPGSGLSSASQVLSTLTVWVVSGVARSLRPLPWQRTCGPAPRWTSWRVEAGELGDPQPGLDGEQEQGVVAAAVPCPAVGGGEQRVGLVGGEVADDGPLAPPWRDRQDLADDGGVLGCPGGGVAEQRVDRGQPGVAGGAAVAPVVFQVLQERADQRGVEVGEAELAGCLPGLGAARSRAAAGTCRGRRRRCSGWPSSAGRAGR